MNPNDTFCVLPFQHMQISNNGVVRLCCQTQGVQDAAGKTMNVYQHPAVDIWNSDTMQNVRRSMIEGRKVSDCSVCWTEEANGGSSRRQFENASFSNRIGKKQKLLGLLRGREYKLDDLKAEALGNDFIMRESPSDLEIEVGNLCNLKCRMCNPTHSSKIENDPIHARWYAGVPMDQQSDPSSRFPAKTHWFREKTFTYGELLNQPKAIRKLTFKGGEPFASKEAIAILEYLSKVGEPKKTEIHVVTNATISDPKLLEVVGKFKDVVISVSLDGIDDLHEYIRYPAKWSTVSENIQIFSRLRNVWLTTSITFQAYNCLRIVELFRYCDSMGYRMNVNTLNYPSYLAVSAMPRAVRQIAASRLKEYVATDCKQENKNAIQALANGLDAAGDHLDIDCLEQFMVFTNDLDQSRGQRFQDVNPELLGYIEDAGFPWNQETRFAKI